MRESYHRCDTFPSLYHDTFFIKEFHEIWRFNENSVSLRQFNRTFSVCEQVAEATHGGSVYRRSQPVTAEKEDPRATVQGRGMESVAYYAP